MKNYRLYLVRHGITAGNLSGTYIGSGSDEPLCPEGIAQLEELTELFSYPTPLTVFASPLKRAVQSAEILFPDAQEKIILEDLRECAFGEFEGRKMTELVNDEHFKLWVDPAVRYTPVGGESNEDFHKRCSDALMQIFDHMLRNGLEQAACVTHGGVIMSMLAQRAMPKYVPEHWMADAGCGYELHITSEMFMRDGVAEVVEIVPYGYLDAK